MRWLTALSERGPSRLVAKYYCYQATVTFGFFSPIWVIFLLSNDLSYAQIGLLGSLSAGITVVGEIPTGYVGDRFGRRSSLLAGSTMLTASLFALGVVDSYVGFVAIYAVWALGGAFRSGAGDAWLYDVLDDRLHVEEYTTVRGRGGAVNLTVSAVSMLAAGSLYTIDPALPFYVAGTVNAAGIAVLLTMPTVDPTSTRDAAAVSDSETEDDIVEDVDSRLGVRETFVVLREELFARHVRAVVIGMALFFGAAGTANTFVQPIALDDVGLSTAALGPLYTAFSLVAAAASYNAGRIEDALGRRRALWGVPVVLGVALVVPLAVTPVLALPAFFVLKASTRALQPIASGFINDHVDSVGRATVLSAAAMCYALVRAVLKPLGGVVADTTGELPTLAAIGAVLLATVALANWLDPSTRDDAPGTTGDPAIADD
jgi:MFS family permease